MKPLSAALRLLLVTKRIGAQIQNSVQHRDPSAYEPPSALFTPWQIAPAILMHILATGLCFGISENDFPH